MDSDTRRYESLILPDRLELAHPSLPDTGIFVRLLYPIVGVLRCIVKGLRDQLSMGDAITPQLVGDDFPGLSSIAPQ